MSERNGLPEPHRPADGMSGLKWCSARVRRGRGLHDRCHHPATCHEDGKPWCSIHRPTNVACRAARRARERERRNRIQAAERRVIDAARAWAKHHPGHQSYRDTLIAQVEALEEAKR